jgi:hypothetical protein
MKKEVGKNHASPASPARRIGTHLIKLSTWKWSEDRKPMQPWNELSFALVGQSHAALQNEVITNPPRKILNYLRPKHGVFILCKDRFYNQNF